MQLELRKIGNSVGLIVPKAILTQMGIVAGSRVDLSVEDNVATIKPIANPREGWAEAAAVIGALPLTAEEEDWLAFGNDGDDELVW